MYPYKINKLTLTIAVSFFVCVYGCSTPVTITKVENKPSIKPIIASIVPKAEIITISQTSQPSTSPGEIPNPTIVPASLPTVIPQPTITIIPSAQPTSQQTSSGSSNTSNQPTTQKSDDPKTIFEPDVIIKTPTPTAIPPVVAPTPVN